MVVTSQVMAERSARAESSRLPEPEPHLVAPGIISSATDDESFAVMPDGQRAYLARVGAILVTHRSRKTWSVPEVASFSGRWRDTEPTIAPDGSFLVFASNRPISDGGAPLDGHWDNTDLPGLGGNLWKMNRTATGWSAPVRLPDTVNRGSSTSVFSPAISKDGSLYFMDQVEGKFRIFRSQFRDGSYATAEALPFTAGDWEGNDPAVAPDESFLIFSSRHAPARQNDLVIIFRDGGKWGAPVNLGERLNSPDMDVEPRLGPDGHTLYFASDRTVAPRFPRTAAQAKLDLAAGAAWNNGTKNIWQVDLSPWISAHRSKAKPTGGVGTEGRGK